MAVSCAQVVWAGPCCADLCHSEAVSNSADFSNSSVRRHFGQLSPSRARKLSRQIWNQARQKNVISGDSHPGSRRCSRGTNSARGPRPAIASSWASTNPVEIRKRRLTSLGTCHDGHAAAAQVRQHPRMPSSEGVAGAIAACKDYPGRCLGALFAEEEGRVATAPNRPEEFDASVARWITGVAKNARSQIGEGGKQGKQISCRDGRLVRSRFSRLRRYRYHQPEASSF